ncbi:penicillin-binding protein 2 [Microbacterium sp. EYE_5]|uniref:peptidoglycan D,D-transpeptidase FtsI family protein n=1 Tax=unclassified Microbacterium TaxID=2609290 RepID=UPI0020034F2E|nr:MULTISPECIES: penicillin-binding protein 2 [unclassified Microbacterium]MCK6080442.1 penicillin-binding protein 2 [Microbacterium sp. EYE_382]MCK6085713.1 penicillin-binding protein 2 [Microbacterium sp. EYE_384]MCK6124789.1 penicillin-binding protein 2 [Microbacterium sp. EYE_80]MCK6127698.1 penicillin-binding protein 2 [Microbacterium sp. EYE_79]MCK6141397.1 penicillin-binding protein 2 [Microbacterium sp. EYE_39]
MTTRATRGTRRRTVVALAVILVVLVAFVVRLIDIQVVNASQHVEDSFSVGMKVTANLEGARGSIVDEHGVPLATSTLVYNAKLDPKLAIEGVSERDAQGRVVKDENGDTVTITWDEIAQRIAEVTGQDAADVRAIVTDALEQDPNSRFAYLDQNISTAEYRALDDLGLPFLKFDSVQSRVYPNGAVAGNLLGFVGSDGKPLEGVEELQNSCLTPENGSISYQRGADGVRIPGTAVEKPAVNGGTVTLTIDSDLQWYMQQLIAEETDRYKADWGGIIVMETATGKIRAMAETPTVDPNDPGASEPEDRGSRLLRYSYEPGSTFKPVTAATAIEQAGATPGTTVNVPDRMVFDNGAVVNDSENHATEDLTLTGGLVTSSNVAMSQFGAMVDNQTRYDYLQKFGAGQPSGLDWSGEPETTLRPADEWDSQTKYATTFGQAFTVTAVQVASAYQTFANGGVRMPASLIESCTQADGTVVTPDLPGPERIIQEKTADEVSLMLENVFAQGTLAEDIELPGYRMAGKTGTAQVSDGKGGYKPNLYFTSLVGFAPADDPQYVVLTVFDEPKKQRMSSANRSVFKKAMAQVLTHYRVMPSGSETPLLPVTG